MAKAATFCEPERRFAFPSRLRSRTWRKPEKFSSKWPDDRPEDYVGLLDRNTSACKDAHASQLFSSQLSQGGAVPDRPSFLISKAVGDAAINNEAAQPFTTFALRGARGALSYGCVFEPMPA